ncbi:MAG: DUF2269 family protein [Thermoleophilia bacterium]|nr:DUF2269 family protein [Thermoleophilia bacterium]
MVLRQSLLLLHLMGMMLLVAGVGASIACKAAALRSSSPQVIHELLRTASRSVRLLSMPGSYLLLLAGLGLVYRSHGWYSMSDAWIVGAIVAWLASAAVGIWLHAPRSRTARALASSLAADGAPASAELRDLIRGGRLASALDFALLLTMVTLMVFKPG